MKKIIGIDRFKILIPGLLCFLTLPYCVSSGTDKVNESFDNAALSHLKSQEDKVTAPPDSLKLDSFYKKYLDASGIPIVGSEKVPDEAFLAVRKVINKMVSMRSDVLEKMIEQKCRMAIMAKEEVTSDIPEYRNVNAEFPGHEWDKDRGTGATTANPVSTCAEENVLCYGEGKDPYFYEDILIHEFAHAVHGLGIALVDPGFEKELEKALAKAKKLGVWKNTYAESNTSEYFAEGVQCWYNLNAEAIPADGIHNRINTREELRRYNPMLYAIIKRYFAEDDEPISCHPQQ